MAVECINFNEYMTAEVKYLRGKIDEFRERLEKERGKKLRSREVKDIYYHSPDIDADIAPFRASFCRNCKKRHECGCWFGE